MSQTGAPVDDHPSLSPYPPQEYPAQHPTQQYAESPFYPTPQDYPAQPYSSHPGSQYPAVAQPYPAQAQPYPAGGTYPAQPVVVVAQGPQAGHPVVLASVRTGAVVYATDNPWVSVFAYFFGWVSGLIVLLIEHRCAYNVFHAWQSILISLIFTAGVIVFSIIDAAAIGFSVLTWIWWIPFFVLWIVCMVMAHRHAQSGVLFKVGPIGRYAEKRTAIFSPRV